MQISSYHTQLDRHTDNDYNIPLNRKHSIRGHRPRRRQVAQAGYGSRAAVGTGLIRGESHEQEVVAEKREVVSEQWWVMGIEGELHGQDVVGW